MRAAAVGLALGSLVAGAVGCIDFTPGVGPLNTGCPADDAGASRSSSSWSESSTSTASDAYGGYGGYGATTGAPVSGATGGCPSASASSGGGAY